MARGTSDTCGMTLPGKRESHENGPSGSRATNRGNSDEHMPRKWLSGRESGENGQDAARLWILGGSNR